MEMQMRMEDRLETRKQRADEQKGHSESAVQESDSAVQDPATAKVMEKLKKLKGVFDIGVLSKDEYDQKKEKLLAELMV